MDDVHFFTLDTADASTVTLCATQRVMLVTARTTCESNRQGLEAI